MKYNMGISLSALNNTASNHENRIKALENASSAGLTGTIKQLGGSDGRLNESMQNYTFIIISVNYLSNPYSPITIPSKLYKQWGTVKWDERGGQNADRHYGGEYKYISDTQIGTGGNYAGLHSVWGLKLYYNFSYNIYKLANSISFHFFKCLIKIRN